MTKHPLSVEANKAHFHIAQIEGKLIEFENEKYYKISNSDAINPFSGVF